jgi:hypothetical protein
MDADQTARKRSRDIEVGHAEPQAPETRRQTTNPTSKCRLTY